MSVKRYLSLPEINHHPYPNILPGYFGKSRFVKSSEYIEYPSVKMRFDDCIYMEVVELLSKMLDVNCIFFDGEVVIIPEYYTELIHWLEKYYSGTVEERCYGKEYEFVTLAIKTGLIGEIVALGHAIAGLDGTPQEMLANARLDPEATLLRWSVLYKSSMIEH
jgi:hypothetical protein